MSSEHEIQRAFVDWARWSPDSRLKWLYSVPNGAQRTFAHVNRLRGEGLKPGVADMCLPVASGCGGYHALYLEFKTKKGRLSDKQYDFQCFCNQHDNKYVIVRSVDQAIKAVEEYLKND